MFLKKTPQMTQICAFKEKEKEGGEGRPPLNSLWKIPMFGGLWNVLMFCGP
jgi:hypothetical protein